MLIQFAIFDLLRACVPYPDSYSTINIRFLNVNSCNRWYTGCVEILRSRLQSSDRQRLPPSSSDNRDLRLEIPSEGLLVIELLYHYTCWSWGLIPTSSDCGALRQATSKFLFTLLHIHKQAFAFINIHPILKFRYLLSRCSVVPEFLYSNPP